MIRSQSFIKRDIGNQTVIVAVGEATKKFHGMISLNRTGAYIWDLLENETTLDAITEALVARYEIDAATARADAAEFIETLKGVGAIA
jgi:hypothetical protein